MANQLRELLVVLARSSPTETLARLGEVAAVVEVFPPRLAIVRADAGARQRIARLTGVVAIYDEGLPEFMDDFTSAERQFASEWAGRVKTDN